MAKDVWARLNIKPYNADDSKVSFPLGEMKPPPPMVKAKDTSRNIGQVLLDTDAQFGKGAGSLVQTIGDIGQLVTGDKNSLQSYGQEVKDFYENLISPQYKQGSKNISTAIKSKDGEMSQAWEAVKQYATNPSQLAGAVVESIPAMAIGGLPGKGLGLVANGLRLGEKGVTRATIGGAMAGESILQGGQTGGEVLRGDLNTAAVGDFDTMTPKYTKEEILNRARIAALGSAATTAFTYAIPGSTTVERGMLGIENKVGSRTANGIKGLAGEGAQEGIQGVTGQMAQNYAEYKPIMEGTGEKGAVGTLIGGLMGGGVGFSGKPRFSADKVAPKADKHIKGHEDSVYEKIMKNEVSAPADMKPVDGEKFDPNVDVGITRAENTPEVSDPIPEAPSVTDHPSDTLPSMNHQEVFGQVMGEHLDSARAEGGEVYPKVLALAQDPKSKPAQVAALLDNIITPSHDDIAISDLLNNGDPLPSRFTGMRIVDVLERNIKIAIDNPTGAKTNIDLSNALKKEGFSKELNNVFTKAYTAKDSSILVDHILQKTQPLAEDIRTQLDDHLSTYKAQSEKQKADAWDAAVPPEAVDLVSHPKFLEHLDDRADISAEDTRYAQTRVADMTLSHENNGQGYETVVQQPAMFERNYNADFEMTKKDVADIKAGRWSEPLVQKLRNDLDRRDNDPLYNPEKSSETILNTPEKPLNDTITPYQTLHAQISDAMGPEHADMNMALIEGRAKAMGITADELIDKTGVSVKDFTNMDGMDYLDSIGKEGDILTQSMSKDQKEKRGIYNVQFNGKKSTEIIKDIESIDSALKFEQGFENQETGKGYGALHIDKHIGSDKDGWVSKEELLNIGEAVRNIEPISKDGKRVYEYHNDAGDRFRVIVGDKNGGERVISFYSNRKAGKGNNTLTYIYPSSPDSKILHQKIQDVKLTHDQINGMVEMGYKDTHEMKNDIYLFKTADASTVPHELMHVFERTLSDTERATVDDVFKGHEVGTPRSEALAKGFEKYLAEGEAPTPELKTVFEKFRNWLTKLWENIAHNKSRDFELNDGHRELYRALLGDKEAAAKLSTRYEGIVNEKIRAEGERAFQRETLNNDTIASNKNNEDVSMPESTVLFQKYNKSSSDSRNALQKVNDAYDNVIENVFDTVGNFARGVDKNGDVIIRVPHEYDVITKGQNVLDGVREMFITNGRKSDALVDLAHGFDNVRGYLADEAKALVNILKGYDKEMVTQGEAPKQITKGALLVRALGGDLDPVLLPKEMMDVYTQMRHVIDTNTKALIEAGELAPEHAKENYLKRYYMEHITNKGMGLGGITQSGKHARSELDLETRQEMGQIEDAAYVITRTMLDQRLQLEKANYFKKMADKFGSDVAKEGYIQMSKKTADDGRTPLYGALAGKYVPKYVADELRGIYEVGNALDQIVKGLSVPVDFIKVTQTVKNPGTHVYNVGSNMYISYMDGHLTELAEIAMMIKKDPQKFRAITKAASKQGLNGMGVDLEKSILKANTDGKAMTIIKNLLLTQDSKSGEFTRNAYDWEDKIFKLAKFYKEMKRNGMKIDDASAKKYMEEVHKIYVDHSKPVLKFIRNMDKSGISPFLSYMWRSAPQVAYVTLKHPLRFAAFHAVLAPMGASAIWNAISGDDEEDKSIKARFMDAGGFNMLGIENFYKTDTDENGFDSYANIGRMAPGMRFMPDKGSPLLLYSDGGFAADIIGGVFRGKNNKGTIYNEYDSNTEKAVKTAAMLSEYVLPPILPAVPLMSHDKTGDGGGKQFENDGKVKQETVSVGGRYGQKFNQAVTGKRDSYDQPVTVGDVAKQAIGMKTYRVDPTLEGEKQYDKLIPEIKRAIAEGDMEKAQELADKVKDMDLPKQKQKPNDTKKKEAITAQKEKMDNELERLGVKRESAQRSSNSFFKPINISPSFKLIN